MAATQLADLRTAPAGRAPEIRTAWKYLVGAHKSVAGLFDSLAILRKNAVDEQRRAPQGRLSSDQLDVLRAAIVFTSSGLDACMSRLVQDVLPVLLDRKVPEVERRFVEFVKRELSKREVPQSVTTAVIDADPRAALVRLYVDGLTRASFQGSGDMEQRVKGALCLPNAELPSDRFAALDKFFESRNLIVHAMDYEDPTGRRTARTNRPLGTTVEWCDGVFVLCSDIIHVVASKLKRGAANA